jgi:hypothetical protein
VQRVQVFVHLDAAQLHLENKKNNTYKKVFFPDKTGKKTSARDSVLFSLAKWSFC